MRVSYETMYTVFSEVLQKNGMTPERAGQAAKLFTDASRGRSIYAWIEPFPTICKKYSGRNN